MTTMLGPCMSRPRRGGIRQYVRSHEPASPWPGCEWNSRQRPRSLGTTSSRLTPSRPAGRTWPMADLRWFEIAPPRDLELAQLTGLTRVLSDRPRSAFGDVPAVALELWSLGGDVYFRLGVDRRIAHRVVAEIRAQLPRTAVVPTTPARPNLRVAA